MKNIAKSTGLVALAAVIWFSMASCGNGGGGGGSGGGGGVSDYDDGDDYDYGDNPYVTYPDWMVQIPGGTFIMGSPESEEYRQNYETQHQVTLSAFSIGKHEVTQAQWYEVMGFTIIQQRNRMYNYGLINAETVLFDKKYGEGDNYPMYYVSWYEALVFCNKLSISEGLRPAYRIDGKINPYEWGRIPIEWNEPQAKKWDSVVMVAGSNGYRLPTEAQWEYACRAGTTTAYNTGEKISDDTGWYHENSDYETHEVGLKPSNAWGMYDMHGNVNEWCWDWYGTYPTKAQTNPTGPSSSGSNRILRGGGFSASYDLPNSNTLRSACRMAADPRIPSSNCGFRLVRP